MENIELNILIGQSFNLAFEVFKDRIAENGIEDVRKDLITLTNQLADAIMASRNIYTGNNNEEEFLAKLKSMARGGGFTEEEWNSLRKFYQDICQEFKLLMNRNAYKERSDTFKDK